VRLHQLILDRRALENFAYSSAMKQAIVLLLLLISMTCYHEVNGKPVEVRYSKVQVVYPSLSLELKLVLVDLSLRIK